jgi:Uncharacterized conserved protein (DUF2358)
MDILDILRSDYRNFPKQQTFSIYDEQVYFKDPMTEFRGCDRYQKMIQFIETWFIEPELQLHKIEQRVGKASPVENRQIRTDWTLRWTTPLPWKPRTTISGWTELTLNDSDQIISHIDFWHCSRWDVVKQQFGR